MNKKGYHLETVHVLKRLVDALLLILLFLSININVNIHTTIITLLVITQCSNSIQT